MLADSWPANATVQSSVMASTWFAFAAAAAGVAFVVLALVLYPLVRWRRRPGDAMPEQFRNNYALEIGWTAVPLLLVAGLFTYTFRAEARVDGLARHPDVVVAVSGYRWGWTFAYRGGPTIDGPSYPPAVFGERAAAPELVLPLGETTRIELSARDVNHGFWVPDFLFKRDAIAGQTTSFDLDPSKLGTFAGKCSSFCGLDHTRMLFSVRVVSPRAFVAWERGRT
ncbi:MAG: cytochrome c oxidase subunit II [Candidatus Eremiobacteraeota bacterium]|nr:cytochrome c oxidase subunit II [Candidatus Eremiobacteraeota bacterium]